jgi:hypothetical protein
LNTLEEYLCKECTRPTLRRSVESLKLSHSSAKCKECARSKVVSLYKLKGRVKNVPGGHERDESLRCLSKHNLRKKRDIFRQISCKEETSTIEITPEEVWGREYIIRRREVGERSRDTESRT